MSESTPEPIFDDMQFLMAESRELALLYRHGFIDIPHFFVAMLRLDCAATPYCKDFNVTEWEEWLEKFHPANEDEEEGGSLPLTLYAGHVVEHAYTIANTNGEEETTSVHVLLAILCINEEVTTAFNKKGILFEDVAEAHFGRPVQKTVPQIHLRRKKPYSWFDKFLFSKESRASELEQLASNAYELYAYDLYDDCLTICEAALSLDPLNSMFLQQRVYCYGAKRDYTNALKCLNELLEVYPELRQEFGIALAAYHDELGQHGTGYGLLVEFIEADPDNETLLNNMGFNLYLQGRYAEAIPYYEKSIAIAPEFAYPWDNLGFVLYKLGQKEKALELIDRSLEFDKGNSFAYKYKGIIFLEEGNKKEALRNFQLALRYGYTAKYGNEVLELMEKV